MNKEFIPYEQALALKELGFDEPCQGYYDVDKGYSIGYAFCYSNRESQPENGCLAPLYQQAFRWFREKYNLYYSIQNQQSLWFFNRFSLKGFKTYEEAELECLKKLIEIVKNK